jgi:TetR/AcrR family transcriptional repressor of bet genes
VTIDPPKLRRADPDERRDLLIAATLSSLARDGHAGISVRRIAAEAGVSVGLLNHHFGSIDALIAETYQKLANELTSALWAQVEQAEGAAARLDTFLSASFSPRVMDPDLLGVWVVFWSLIRQLPCLPGIDPAAAGRPCPQRKPGDPRQPSGGDWPIGDARRTLA